MSIRPTRLHSPPRLLRAILAPIWAALLLLALVAQVGGTWQVFSNYSVYNPPFASLGLISYGGRVVSGVPGVAQAESIPRESTLNMIGNESVSETVTYVQLSGMLAGPMGSRVSLRFALPDGTKRNLELQRSEENYRIAAPRWQFVTDRVLIPILGVLAAGFGLYVSILMWRKRDDPVAPLLAFGLIGLVLTSGPALFFLEWAIANQNVAMILELINYLVALTCLSVAILAFPDGRYYPSWGGWLALVAPVVSVLLVGFTLAMLGAGQSALPSTPDSIVKSSSWVFGGLILVAILAAAVRFRAMPAGLEKQKVKWAALGLAFGLFAIAFADNVLPILPVDGTAALVIDVAVELVRTIGMVAIPLGIFMSLMELRLNDADRAIGRSVGYVLITLLVGAVWAASTTWMNDLIGNRLSPAAAAGLSTILAAAIFVPTRERILKWTEGLLQPAMVKLRSLPAKILPWREDHTPTDVARGTLLAIVNGIHATSAALVITEEARDKVIATYEVTADLVMQDLARDDVKQRMFPMYVTLSDLCGPVGWLLIGPRSDGASYSSDEKDAIELVAGPLAEVLRATSRRAGRDLAMTQMLTSVDARLARLETRTGV